MLHPFNIDLDQQSTLSHRLCVEVVEPNGVNRNHRRVQISERGV
jgi:hypothetical protein